MSYLRERLQQKSILIVPGVYDALLARLVEAVGFEAVYLSGAGVSYTQLGQPDLGLVTMTEMVERLQTITHSVNIPCIADADTGYGNSLNIIRTVRAYEQAGAAAIQLEDQVFPKRCGHLSGKQLIETDEMVLRLRAALDARQDSGFLIIARTDACSVCGLDEALRRGERYLAAGADVLFIESPPSIAALERIGREFGQSAPLLVNMVEGGLTPLVPAHELEQLGFRIVIFPNSLTRRIARAALEFLQRLKSTGSTESCLPDMLTFFELNQLLGLDYWRAVEERFTLRA